jgi:2-dehydropantoate 2-reductase
VLGALLARAGHSVAFVARGASLEVLRSDGLVVSTDTGPIATGPLAAFEEPAEVGPCELVLVTVKTWLVAPLAPTLRPLLARDALVVPLQNGVEAADHLARALGDEAVVGGLCHVIATRQAPGRMKVGGAAFQITLGERSGGTSERLDRLAEVLRAAGLTATVRSDIDVALWSKLLFVEPLGSVGAVTRSSVDVVRALPETRALLLQAMREVQAVALGAGVPVTDAVVTDAMARIDGLPVGATASMHRDLIEGRASELDEQTGVVVRRGRDTGVPCPVHDVLWASLLPLARGHRVT